MKNCNCNRDINISSADIILKPGGAEGVTVRKNDIQIIITREPDTPTIAELRRQIEELHEIGLEFSDLDRKLKEALEELDVVSKAALMELLESYVQKGDLDVLKTELKEWANARFMRKMFLTQSAYDALEEKEENVLYCII
jgi:hypothetical protein